MKCDKWRVKGQLLNRFIERRCALGVAEDPSKLDAHSLRCHAMASMSGSHEHDAKRLAVRAQCSVERTDALHVERDLTAPEGIALERVVFKTCLLRRSALRRAARR